MAREMKDSGIEWIGEIPAEWEIIRHKHVMHKEKTICDHYDGADIISLTMNGVIVRDLDAGGKMPTTFDGYQYVEPDDLLLCLFDIDVTPRCVGLVKNKGLTSPAYSRFKVHKGYFNAYYDYLLRSIDDDKVFVHLSKNLRSSLTETDFGQLPTIAPPLEEQKKIASFLDDNCLYIDSVIEQTSASIEEYKKLKQAVITQAVTKGIRPDRPMKDSGIEWIGNYPSDWAVIKIKWLLNERNERSTDGKEEPLSMSQKYGLIPTKNMDMIPNMASTFVGAKLCYNGDLVFNKLKAHLGVFAVSEYEGLVSPDYAVYYSKGNADPKFLEYLFKTPQYIGEFKKKATGVGAGLTRLYTSGLYSIYCALPPILEQKQIVSYINMKEQTINQLVERKEAIITNLDSYKKSLIYEYVTGKKEVPA